MWITEAPISRACGILSQNLLSRKEIRSIPSLLDSFGSACERRGEVTEVGGGGGALYWMRWIEAWNGFVSKDKKDLFYALLVAI